METFRQVYESVEVAFKTVTTSVLVYILIMTAISATTFLFAIVIFLQNISLKRYLKKFKSELIPVLPKEKKRFSICTIKEKKKLPEQKAEEVKTNLSDIIEKINNLANNEKITDEELKEISLLVEEEKSRVGKTQEDKTKLNESLGKLLKIMSRTNR